MLEEIASRAQREKSSYDDGNVHSESTKLHVHFAHVFSCPNTERMEKQYRSLIAQAASGADMLDYGCYDGWMTPEYSALGPKKIYGIDISEKGIGIARDRYGNFADFRVGDAHAMPFDDASFDLVVGRAILHHLDFDLALQEIWRVLRPGGSAFFIEPLGDNPAAKFARLVTPSARTADEAPLSRQQIERADRLFGGNANHHFAGLTSVPIGMISSLVSQNPRNVFLLGADAIDRACASTPLKYWMRVVALAWSKQASN